MVANAAAAPPGLEERPAQARSFRDRLPSRRYSLFGNDVITTPPDAVLARARRKPSAGAITKVAPGGTEQSSSRGSGATRLQHRGRINSSRMTELLQAYTCIARGSSPRVRRGAQESPN